MSMFYKTCDKQLADTGSHMRAATVDSVKNWATARCGLRAGR